MVAQYLRTRNLIFEPFSIMGMTITFNKIIITVDDNMELPCKI